MDPGLQVVRNDLEYICNNLREELSSLEGKSLLLTGGAGFLGYYLAQCIVFWNGENTRPNAIHLAVYDNFSRGMPGWLREIEEKNKAKVVRHDIRNPLSSDTPDFQFIIHGASIASPTYYRMEPIATMDTNVNGLRNLLEYARIQEKKKKPVEGFLFFSSSEIYGDPTPENIPTPETYFGHVSCTGPRACYDESKRYGETLCVNFVRQYDLPIKIARPFNNYGPGLKLADRRVLPDFVNDVLAGRDIVLFSDGSPTRTFCYVADAIVGYYKVLVKGGKGEAYNIGVEEPEITIGDLAKRVGCLARKMFDYKGKIIERMSPDGNYLTDNPRRRCPMITKARNELGYNPAISLEEGLQQSLLWYRDHWEGEEVS